MVIVRQLLFCCLWIKSYFQCKFGEVGFNIMRGSGVVVGMGVFLVFLWINEQVFLFQVYQCIFNGGVIVWVVLYGLFNDVGYFMVVFIVYLFYGV